MRRLSSALLLAAVCACAAPPPIRALILSGRNNHDWRTTTPHLRMLLERSGRFDVRVDEEPSGLDAKALANYEVLVLDYQGPRWGAVAERAVEDFVRSGKGLVAVHAASYAFGGLEILGDGHKPTGIREPAWTAYGDMIGAVWSEDPAAKTGHAPRHVFTVKYADRAHPVARGLDESFRTYDELYHLFRMRPGVHVLATAFDDPANGGTGRDEPLLWTVSYGKGRVFHTALGHDVAAMQTPGFAASFIRGAEWAATGEVTLPANPTARRDPSPVRVEVVTGGHDHEASFYSIFEHRDDLAVNVNPHPDAYRASLAKNVDVLVLYDMVQDTPEPRRTNLQAFLESGKGMVVLHHAIASYQDWPWWYEQVVGGRYLLKPYEGRPPSTYQHDIDLFVTPEGKHPITEGIGPMYIHDEGYKGMWLSPKSRVILRTKHDAADEAIAWISPYEKSRVVYIALGHGREAHEHPAFRELVHRAILWAAGRLGQ